MTPITLLAPLPAGLARLRELWPPELVDAQALADSDAVELALAVRSLSDRPPEAY
jgi:hypothetical protein